MEKKLIVPAEVKVCATCSYWDGDRQVDEEFNLVVIAEACRGECLVQEKSCEGLNDVRHMHDCAWESLKADDPEADDASADRKTG
jgi:hypothetical protein